MPEAGAHLACGNKGERRLTDDKRFLERWSRRKAATQTETEKEKETPAAVEPISTALPPAASPESPPTIDPETLPDIDSMDADSDFSPFMQAGVPDALRNRALRKLWQTDPAFNVVDGLLEYGEDYADITAIAETVQSVYKVGKGLVGETESREQSETVEDEQAEDATLPVSTDLDGSKERLVCNKTSSPCSVNNTLKS